MKCLDFMLNASTINMFLRAERLELGLKMRGTTLSTTQRRQARSHCTRPHATTRLMTVAI